MSKQDPFRFNLRFDEEDEVCAFLNACGRKKARYIVKAFQAYWAAGGGELWQAEQETGACLKENVGNREAEDRRAAERQEEARQEEGQKGQESHMVNVVSRRRRSIIDEKKLPDV